jgi:hypothetical protein
MQLFNFNSADDKSALLDYADSQWPYARLWVEGKNSTECSVVSNYNRTSFETINDVWVTGYYFYCEYIGKVKLLQFSIVTFYFCSINSKVERHQRTS